MGALRIIAGEAGGRRLVAPQGRATRPTSDRVRQAIFNLLGQFFSGERVLDLFAGSGAMGLEALSRGAGHATMVDTNPAAIQAIEANLEALGWKERAQVRKQDAAQFLRGARAADYDLIFVDPPYETSPTPILEALGGFGLASGARVVVEHDRGFRPEERYGNLGRWDERRYGQTYVTIFEAGSEEAP